MEKDSSSKMCLVSNFNNYKMVVLRPVMELYNELLRILGQFAQHDLKMDESISISSIIDKLPPSRKDYKHTLKHKKEELNLVQLGSLFRIEESLRAQESDKGKDKIMARPSSVNMVEEGESSRNPNKFEGNKRKFHGNNKKPDFKNKKPKSECWKCNKPGHFKKDCYVGKGKNVGGTSEAKDPRKQQEW